MKYLENIIKEIPAMKFFKIFTILASFAVFNGYLDAQPESEQASDEKTLITIHAEDAFLPSIL